MPRRARDGRLDVQVGARVLGSRLQFGRPDQERPAEGGVGLVDSTAWHGGPLWRDGRRVGPEQAVPRQCRERLDTHGTCFTPLNAPAPAQLTKPRVRARVDRGRLRDMGFPRTGNRESNICRNLREYARAFDEADAAKETSVSAELVAQRKRAVD
jgi:hypothetical protein